MAKQPSRQNRKPSKIRPVQINQMRVPPALHTQRRFSQAQGDKYAAALDLNKLGFPIINHRDGIYWIMDGQHRIYALKQNGFENDVIECEVYEDLTDEEMADIFLGRDDRRPINVFDKFHVACTAGHSREAGIRRAVETQGVRISQSKEENTIGAVSALGKVYDKAGGGRTGEIVVGQVVRTIKNAYAGDAAGFDRGVIEGLGLVFNRYNGKTNEKELASRLAASQHGVRGLLRRAEAQRLRTGNGQAQCVAATVVDIYNKGLGGRAADRLPSWWKTADAE